MLNDNLSVQQMKILLYQYFLHRGDELRESARKSKRLLCYDKKISSEQINKYYIDMLNDEFFDKIQREILDLLNM